MSKRAQRPPHRYTPEEDALIVECLPPYRSREAGATQQRRALLAVFAEKDVGETSVYYRAWQLGIPGFTGPTRPAPAEENPMASQQSSSVQSWKEAAEAQGWTVTVANNGHLKWKTPTGDTVFTNGALSGSSTHGRSMLNARSQLLRAGLIIPGHQRNRPLETDEELAAAVDLLPTIGPNGAVTGYEVVKEEPAPVVSPPLKALKIRLVPETLEELSERLTVHINGINPAMSTLIEMVFEQADQYAKFSKETIESLVELRGKVQGVSQTLAKVDLTFYVTEKELDERLAEVSNHIEARIVALAQAADPIAAFRARLNQ